MARRSGLRVRRRHPESCTTRPRRLPPGPRALQRIDEARRVARQIDQLDADSYVVIQSSGGVSDVTTQLHLEFHFVTIHFFQRSVKDFQAEAGIRDVRDEAI